MIILKRLGEKIMQKKKSFLYIFCLLLCSILFFGCNKPPQTYIASGYVTENGQGVEGVTVSSPYGSAVTDQNGYYEIGNLLGAVRLTASKDNCVFEVANKVFYPTSDEGVNFEAYSYYDVVGRVTQGGLAVGGATVSATGKKSGRTVTDNDGYFQIFNVAGQVDVTVEHNGSQFLTYSATKQSNNLQIDSACVLVGRVAQNDVGIEGVLVASGKNSATTNQNGEFEILKDSATNNLQFNKQGYHFAQSTITISNIDDQINISAFKKYKVSGAVVCGNQTLAGAKVSSQNNPSNFVVTDQNGLFELDELYDTDTIIVEKQGFDCDSLAVQDQASGQLIGCSFDVSGSILSDDGQTDNFQISSGQKSALTKDGRFCLSGIRFGDQICASRAGYVASDNIVINSTDDISFQFFKLYDVVGALTVDGESVGNIVVSAGGKQTVTDQNGNFEIPQIYGNQQVVVDSQAYFVEMSSQNVSASCNQIVVSMQQYYDAELSFVALENSLAQTQILVNGQPFTSTESGTIVFEKLYGEQTFVCSIDNFNAQTVVTTKNSGNQQIVFDFCVSGYATSGSAKVEGAKIFYGQDYVLTDENGHYQIDGLTTECTLQAQKEFYTFADAQTANCNGTINFDSTYKIGGKLAVEGFDVSTITLYLYSVSTQQTVQTNPNEFGEYEFAGLSGEYYLYFDKTTQTSNLKPTGYNVLQGNCNYDFSSKGYKVGGTITCGNLNLQNVKLSAGSSTSKTDENGNFRFDVLFGECTITPQLAGYTFVPSSIVVDETFDGTMDLSFVATYTISGKITCGTQNLQDVVVGLKDTDILTTTDQNGEFVFEGLSGEHQLVVQKDGYNIEGQTQVNGYGTFNFAASFAVNGYAMCGETYLQDVEILGAAQTATNEQGYFEFDKVVYGDVLTAQKQGYVFAQNYVATGPASDVVFESTFGIKGKVVSGKVALAGATIEYGQTSITTDQDGCFEIDGLTQQHTYVASFEGYKSASQVIAAPTENINFNLSFDISGVVLLNGAGLEGVSVVSQGVTATTNANGEFVLQNLYGTGNIVLEKTGYTFTGETSYTKPTTLNFESTYMLKGQVLSGSLPVANLTVYYLQASVMTDSLGWFEIEDLTQPVSLSLIKDGYNPILTDEIFGYVDNLSYNITYNASGKVTGLADLSGISVVATCGDTTFECVTDQNGNYSFDALFGSTVITFSKPSIKFTPSTFAIDKPATRDVAAKEVYTFGGKITATDGSTTLVVANMPIYVGTSIATYTNQNGEYSVQLDGKNTLVAKFSGSNITTLATEQIDISAAGTRNFTLGLNDYIYYLYERAYQNLREADSYMSTMSGSVDAGIGGVQTVGGFRKKGTNGVIMKEDSNYGGEKLGVNPKVAVLTYYDTKTPDQVSYIHHKNVEEGLIIDYSGQTWTDTTVSQYSAKYGLSPTDFTPYIINRNTINAFENISCSNGTTKFTLSLNPQTSTTKYITRMTAYSGQTPSEFYSVKLTYMLNSSGNLVSLQIDESYKCIVSITAQLFETFNEINGTSVGALTRPSF